MYLKLLLFSVCFLLLQISGYSQVWKPLGSGLRDSGVDDLIIYNNELYAAGAFLYSDTNRIKVIARWDGNSWHSISTDSISTIPRAISIYNNDLIVGGTTSNLGNIPFTKRIARWDGTQWHSLNAGITSGTLRALKEYNGSLYVAGNTTQIDSLPIIDIGRWDGSNWHPVCTLSSGLTELYSLEVYHNELYIGGYFFNINGLPISFIGKYDGVNFTSVGGGVNGDVWDMYNDTVNDRLYVTGFFSNAAGGTVPCPSGVAYWDGSNWYTVGPNGPTLDARHIYVHKNEVYAGFIDKRITSNGDTLLAIAKLVGNDWMPVGGGLKQDTFPGTVQAFLTFGDDLIVGGIFNVAGSQTNINEIVAWGDSLTSIQEPSVSSLKVTVHPNPCKDYFTISYPELKSEAVSLEILDMLGNIKYETILPKGSKESSIHLSELFLPGIYICRIKNLNRIFLNKVVVTN